MPWKPPNQPVRYDRARVRQLDPVVAALDQLRLPPVRFRKIGAIRNALEVPRLRNGTAKRRRPQSNLPRTSIALCARVHGAFPPNRYTALFQFHPRAR